MNGTNKNEVDLLLRSLARGQNPAWQSGLSSADEQAASSDHLDADELNSYAEGVVPGPARVRYTEHLADCAVCRGIVVDLTQAAGARHEVAEKRNESSLWLKLAALLSPSVLRFAVPALVLTIVIGIGFLALKQQRDATFVARNDKVEIQPGQSDNGSPIRPSSEPVPGNAGEPAASTNEKTADDKTSVQTKKLQTGQAPLIPDSSLAKAPAKDAKEAAEAGAASSAGGVVDLRPGYAPQPKAAEPPPLLEAEKSADIAMDRSAKREDQDRSRQQLKNQANEIHGPNRGSNNAPMSASQRVVGGLASERGPSAMNKNNKIGEVESRTVLGKRFTRSGAVWVDSDYESQATIKVSRGSEQFRALVADEPGIKTIAERLDGAVIVVWKSRAYRIQ